MPVLDLLFLFLTMLRSFRQKSMLEILNLIGDFLFFKLKILKMKFLSSLMVLEVEPGVLYMLGKHCALLQTEVFMLNQLCIPNIEVTWL